MGPVLNNIENLLRKSYGCGEQNLATLVPSIYVSSYLKATNRLTPELLQKARTYLTLGKIHYVDEYSLNSFFINFYK